MPESTTTATRSTVQCEHCGRNMTVRRTCAVCGCGSTSDCGCCSCPRTAVQYVNRPMVFHSSTMTQRNQSSRMLSVEVEIASASTTHHTEKVCKQWGMAIVHDGSLPSGGFEINTAPANGDLFMLQMEQLGDALKADNAQVTESCGMHVHIDAREFDTHSMARLLALYSKWENMFFEMVPASRKQNHYV